VASVWKPSLLRAVLWLLLGAWLGTWFLFAFSVAPAAFGADPAEQAGQIVGPVIANLHLLGGAMGVALALLARALGHSLWCQALPLLMAALCLGSEFGITGEIDKVRDLAFGAGTPEDAARFWRLHGISMGIYTAVGVLGIALAGLLAVAEIRVGTPPNPGTDAVQPPGKSINLS